MGLRLTSREAQAASPLSSVRLEGQFDTRYVVDRIER